MIDKVDAVVLAGGGGIEEGAPNKALVSINSRLMVDYVVEALKNSPAIRSIILVGDEQELRTVYSHNPRISYAKQGATPLESFAAGIDASESANPWLLACSGDIPFLTTEALDDFIAQAAEHNADFYYPIIRKEAVESRFPGVKRTYVTLRDGTFTGGNLFMVKREIISRCLPLAKDFVRQRKNPAALARMVGLGILWKYFLGSLNIVEIEEKVSKMVGAKGCAIISDYPEIGVDVDKASDLEMAKRLLEG